MATRMARRHIKASDSAGIFPIALSTGRMLVALRSNTVGNPGTYAVWGGGIEGDETPEEAARRELEEESGYAGPIILLGAYVHQKNPSKKYTNFIGIVPSEFDPVLNEETETSEWVTFSELVDLEPKHYGLQALLEHDTELIRKLSLGGTLSSRTLVLRSRP